MIGAVNDCLQVVMFLYMMLEVSLHGYLLSWQVYVAIIAAYIVYWTHNRSLSFAGVCAIKIIYSDDWSSEWLSTGRYFSLHDAWGESGYLFTRQVYVASYFKIFALCISSYIKIVTNKVSSVKSARAAPQAGGVARLWQIISGIIWE